MSEVKHNKSKWLHIRLADSEHERILKKFSSSTCRKLSEYARRVLLDKKVTVNYRNHSLDDFMAEMMKLRNELNAIGNNVNQSVKKLHVLDAQNDIKIWLVQNEINQRKLLEKAEEIKSKINQISDEWLR